MSPKERVLIVGGGAAGVACAWSLAKHGQHEVHLWEASPHLGGVATSTRMPDGRWINDQVQGGAYTYHNALEMLKQCGVGVDPVEFKVCFGQGKDQWTNFGRTAPVIRECADDIARFGRMLPRVGLIRGAFTTISTFLENNNFSKKFKELVVLPLVSLFLGTGDQACNVPVSVVAQMFFNPQLKLFDYSERGFMQSSPRMFAFPPLRAMYRRIRKCGLRGVRVGLSRKAVAVTRDGGKVHVVDQHRRRATFDKIVFACSAEAALGVLKDPNLAERWLLPKVEYFDDLAVTHTDAAYLRDFQSKSDGPVKFLTKLREI